MEWETNLNFKFKKPELNQKFVDSYNKLEPGQSIETMLSFFSDTTAETQEQLRKFLSNEEYLVLFGSGINHTKTKLSLDFMTGHEEESFITSFFNLIVALGGRPLKSTSIGDGFMETIYTYSEKRGLIIEHKEEDEDY